MLGSGICTKPPQRNSFIEEIPSFPEYNDIYYKVHHITTKSQLNHDTNFVIIYNFYFMLLERALLEQFRQECAIYPPCQVIKKEI